MSHLMYDTTKDIYLNREQLNMVPTPAPMGVRHQPYGFGRYVDDVHHALDLSGIEVRSEEYAVTKDEGSMFGVMEIGAKPLEGELITATEWELLLGLRGGNTQRIRRGMVLGYSVLVCSNLCFSGNVASFGTKQTLNIGARLPGLIREAVQHIPAMAHRQERVFDAFHNTTMEPKKGDNALVTLYRNDALSPSQLGRAIDEWHEPSYEEHTAEEWSAWRLMNAVTQSLKPTGSHVNMDLVSQRSQMASQYIEKCCHIDF